MEISNVLGYLNKQELNCGFNELKERQAAYLGGRWHFLPQKENSFWHTIKVPSFWNTPEQFDHEENWKDIHEAWYGYSFKLDELIFEKHDLFLCFQGVSLLSDIYLNGKFVGSHGGRFTPFEFKINDYVKFNEKNTLAIYVKDLSHSLSEDGQALHYSVGLMKINGGNGPDPFMADHPFFGGIWQPVYLEKRPTTRVEQLQVITSVRNCSIKNRLDIYSAQSGKVKIKNYVCSFNDNTVEFTLPEKETIIAEGETAHIDIEAEWSAPRLWSLEDPYLYNMVTEVYSGDTLLDRKITRFGFREFWIDEPDFYLNGKKTKLFGESINMIQQLLCSHFRKDYITLLFRTLKEQLNMTCLRLHSMIAPQVMVQCADEVGILIIDQSGIWSSAGALYGRGGQKFLDNVRKEFHEWIRRDINSPSVVIWDVENEILRGGNLKPWALELDSFVKEIDQTRPIVHSGAGGAKGHNSFYHIHHNEHYGELCRRWLEKPDKPMVMGEWWIGGRAGITRNITGFSERDRNSFIERIAGLYHDTIIELRTLGVSGIMPYCFIGYVFEPLFDCRTRLLLSDAGAMESQPDFAAAYGLEAGGSRELVNPGWDISLPAYRLNNNLKYAFQNGFANVAAFIKERDASFKSGDKINKTVVIINDSPETKELKLNWSLGTGGAAYEKGSCTYTIKNGERLEAVVEFKVPVCKDDQQCILEVWLQEGSLRIHEDCLKVNFLAEKDVLFSSIAPVSLYDIKGFTAELFTRLNIPYKLESVENIRNGNFSGKCLIIGAYSSNPELNTLEDEILGFIQQGGKVWVMQQAEPVAWLPVKLGFSSCEVQTPGECLDLGMRQPPTTRGIYYSRYVPVYAKGHPVFEGIPDLISYWKDYDGRVVDDIYIKPAASGEKGLYNLRPLSGGTSKEHMSAAEIFTGDGLLLLTQFKLLENAQAEPVSRRLLLNIIGYMLKEERSFKPGKTAVLGETTCSKIKDIYHVELPEFSKEDMEQYSSIIVGPEIEWNTEIEHRLGDWIAKGGEVLVLERRPGNITFYGNPLTIYDSPLLMNSIHFRRGFELTWGLDGSDLEIQEGYNPVQYAVLINNAAYERIRLEGKPISPMADLVNRDKISWWKDMPISSVGFGMLQISVGSGKVTLCQMGLFNDNKVTVHFTRTLFTNLGIPLPLQKNTEESVSVLKAEEISIDGEIEEWICDMEDVNVTRWKHAEPMLLPAHSAYSGSVRDNADCSGVVYLMHDDKNLYTAAQIIDDKVCKFEDEAKGDMDGVELRIDELKLKLLLQKNGTIAAIKEFQGREVALESHTGVWKGAGSKAFKANRDTSFICGGILNPYFTGYMLECAIPFTEINEVQWDKREHDLQVDILDVDKPGEAAARLCYPLNRNRKVIMIME